jgi:hypothetical protein
MQAALLMTEELLGFLVRPSCYRKYLQTHIAPVARAEAGRTPVSDPVAIGIRTVGRRSMQNVFLPQRQPRYRTSVAVADSDGPLRALLGRPDRLLYAAPADRAEAHLEGHHQVQSNPLTHKVDLVTKSEASRAFVDQRRSRPTQEANVAQNSGAKPSNSVSTNVLPSPKP